MKSKKNPIAFKNFLIKVLNKNNFATSFKENFGKDVKEMWSEFSDYIIKNNQKESEVTLK